MEKGNTPGFNPLKKSIDFQKKEKFNQFMLDGPLEPFSLSSYNNVPSPSYYNPDNRIIEEVPSNDRPDLDPAKGKDEVEFEARMLKFVFQQDNVPGDITAICESFMRGETNLKDLKFALLDIFKSKLTHLFRDEINLNQMQLVLKLGGLFVDIFKKGPGHPEVGLVESAIAKARVILDNISRDMSIAAKNNSPRNPSPCHETNGCNDNFSVRSVSTWRDPPTIPQSSTIKYRRGAKYQDMTLKIGLVIKKDADK